MTRPVSIPIVAITAALGVAVMAIAYLLPLASTDTLCRYAPMAEAFACGDWADAFHPRFAVGGTVAAGIFALLPFVDGFRACTLSSSLAWALCVIPVFRLASRLFDSRTAWFAVVLFVICPQPLVWALRGLREPFKMLGILLMVDAVVRAPDCRDKKGFPCEAALAIVFLCLFKCDAILAAIGLGLAYAVADRFGLRTWFLSGWGVLVLQPMCYLVWSWTGYWLPAPHYIPLWKQFFGG